MPLFRIQHLEKSQVPGSFISTDSNGIPIYLSGAANKDMIPVAVSGGFQLMDLNLLATNGIVYDRTTHQMGLGGSLAWDTTISGANFDLNILGAKIITTTSDSFRVTTNDQFRVVSSSTIYMETTGAMTFQAGSYYLYPFNPGNNDTGWTGKVLFVDSNSQLRHGPISTTYIQEGTNLFFTTARARQSFSGGDGITYDSTTGVISSTINSGNFIANQTTPVQTADFNISGTGKAGTLQAPNIYATTYSFIENATRTITTSNDSMLFDVENNMFFRWGIGGTNYLTVSKTGVWINSTSNYGKWLYVNGEAEAVSLRSKTIMFAPLTGNNNGIVYDDTNNIINYRTDNVHNFQGWDSGTSTFKDLLTVHNNGVITFGAYDNTMDDGAVTKVLSVDAAGNMIVGTVGAGLGTLTAANNGLSVTGGNTVQLGGDLIETATIIKMTAENQFFRFHSDDENSFFSWLNNSDGSHSIDFSAALTYGSLSSTVHWNYNGFDHSVTNGTSSTEIVQSATLISLTGPVKFPSYGSGTFTGTPTYIAAFDSNGNIIEVASGGLGALTADNGLTMSTAHNVQFGGTLIQTTNVDMGTNTMSFTGNGIFYTQSVSADLKTTDMTVFNNGIARLKSSATSYLTQVQVSSSSAQLLATDNNVKYSQLDTYVGTISLMSVNDTLRHTIDIKENQIVFGKLGAQDLTILTPGLPTGDANVDKVITIDSSGNLRQVASTYFGVGSSSLDITKFITDYDSAIVGAKDGVNTHFTLTQNYVSGTLHVFLNGVRISPGGSRDYTEDGVNGFDMNYAPLAGDTFVVDYIKA